MNFIFAVHRFAQSVLTTFYFYPLPMLNAIREDLLSQRPKITKSNLTKLTGLTEAEVIELIGLKGLEETVKLNPKTNLKIYGQYPIVKVKVSTAVIRTMKREFHIDQRYVYNNELRLYKTGSGLGFQIFENELNASKGVEMSKFRCWAYGNVKNKKFWNGYITWAKYGYSMIDDDDKENMWSIIDRHIEHDPSLIHLKGVNVHQLVMDDRGEKIWEDEGNDWWGDFYLLSNSENMQNFENYKKKRAEKRSSKN